MMVVSMVGGRIELLELDLTKLQTPSALVIAVEKQLLGAPVTPPKA